MLCGENNSNSSNGLLIGSLSLSCGLNEQKVNVYKAIIALGVLELVVIFPELICGATITDDLGDITIGDMREMLGIIPLEKFVLAGFNVEVFAENGTGSSLIIRILGLNIATVEILLKVEVGRVVITVALVSVVGLIVVVDVEEDDEELDTIFVVVEKVVLEGLIVVEELDGKK